MKIDMHAHSTHSKHPSEWFLQRLGAQESYTPVEQVYQLAKSRGMEYVTITDHNTIDGAMELHAAHPEDTFVSVEVTAYFPENGCKVHVLVYDLTPQQFDAIQKIRSDIYALRDYLRQEDLTCSVAHATYSVNGRMDVDTLEKLILLFDVFEGINGARSRFYNEGWMDLLQNLTPNDVEAMYDRHGIRPWAEDSWIKGFTAGSDDHAGLFIGETYTICPRMPLKDYLRAVRDKQTQAGGRHGGHKSLAFAVYKIACDFSAHKSGGSGNRLFSMINSLIFHDGQLGIKERLTVRRMKKDRETHNRIIGNFFDELADRRERGMTIDDRINRAYNSLANLSDAYFEMIAGSLEKDLLNGDSARIIRNMSASLPALFLSAPFFSSLHHMHQDREHLQVLRKRLHQHSEQKQEKRVLWFTDTINDLNGVAVTLRALAITAHENKRNLRVVTCLPEDQGAADLPPGTLNLPCVYTFTPEFYNAYTFRIPSLLKSIDMIAEYNPDEIIVSTPGPVGGVGLLAARIMSIRCTGIYHTDFKRQADMFIGDEWVSSAVEAYTSYFFRWMNEIRVPTREYMRILSERGLDRTRMKEFRRGIDSSFAMRDPDRQEAIRQRFDLDDAPLLIWAGRLGKEKNLDFLASIYETIHAEDPKVRLMIIGDGPEREALQKRFASNPCVHFPGRVAREELPHYYALADLLVFPSTTDTFGMVVLEAQACGLPALVTNVGGPQEIVKSGNTGRVIPAGSKDAWCSAIREYLKMKADSPAAYRALKEKIRQQALNGRGWNDVIDEMLGVQQPAARNPAATPANQRADNAKEPAIF
jgi:glycosyltransferase involved in cell wall biosynthesis/predicted metal-dependent phosphoesterase TrpH